MFSVCPTDTGLLPFCAPRAPSQRLMVRGPGIDFLWGVVFLGSVGFSLCSFPQQIATRMGELRQKFTAGHSRASLLIPDVKLGEVVHTHNPSTLGG